MAICERAVDEVLQLASACGVLDFGNLREFRLSGSDDVLQLPPVHQRAIEYWLQQMDWQFN